VNPMPYSHVFEGLWLLLAAYWIATAFGNKRAVYRSDPRKRLAALVLVAALVLAFRAYPGVFDRRIFPCNEAASWIGMALCAAGVAFAIWARRTLGANWSANPSIKEGHELIQCGPYRLARHPIYTGLLVAVLGTQLGGGRVRELVILVGSLVVAAKKIQVEEGLMVRQFPEAYPQYRNRTKALIPFVL